MTFNIISIKFLKTIIINNPLQGSEVKRDKEDIYKIHCVLTGPKNSPYEDERIPYTIEFPQSYPFDPPMFRIQKLIFHPIYFNGNAECCDCWAQTIWQPAKSLRSLITDLIDLLLKPRISHQNLATNVLQRSEFEYFESAYMYHKEEKQREKSAVNIQEIINLPCKLNHNRPIVEVILNKHLKSNEMLICQQCQLSISETKTIDITQFEQKLLRNRRSLKENIEVLENKFQTQSDNFQKRIQTIQDLDYQVFQELLSLQNDWIVLRQEFKQQISSISISEEIEQVEIEPKEKKKFLKEKIQSIDQLFLQKIYSCIDKLVLQQDRQNYKEVIHTIFKQPHFKYKFYNISHNFVEPSQSYYAFSINSDNTLLITIQFREYSSSFEIHHITKRQNDHQYELSPYIILDIIKSYDLTQCISWYFRSFNVNIFLIKKINFKSEKFYSSPFSNFNNYTSFNLGIQNRVTVIKFLFTKKLTFACFNRRRGLQIVFPKKYDGENPVEWGFQNFEDDYYINCLAVRQSDDLIVTGNNQGMITFRPITNEPVQIICLSNAQVWGLSFNQQGDRLLSCQQNNEILLIEQGKEWIVKQKILMDGFGYRICFITNEIFAIQTRTPNPHNQIYIYTSDSNGQFIRSGQLFVNGGNYPCDAFFPIQYIPSKQLLISKNGYSRLNKNLFIWIRKVKTF